MRFYETFKRVAKEHHYDISHSQYESVEFCAPFFDEIPKDKHWGVAFELGSLLDMYNKIAYGCDVKEAHFFDLETVRNAKKILKTIDDFIDLVDGLMAIDSTSMNRLNDLLSKAKEFREDYVRFPYGYARAKKPRGSKAKIREYVLTTCKRYGIPQSRNVRYFIQYIDDPIENPNYRF